MQPARLIPVAALLLLSSLARADEPAAAKTAVPLDQAALEKGFAETMSGAVMEGSFTVTGEADDKSPKTEKYTLGKVKKLKGDFWLFETRVQYGEKDVVVPMQLEVKWAGDTPVITLTDLMIPGLGTFTARVVVYRDHYAGFWSGTDHGGHLFGRITKGDKPEAKP